MKKLMMLLSAVALATSVHAATCSWAVGWNCTSDFADVGNASYWLVALGADGTAGITVDTTGNINLNATASVVDSGAATAWDMMGPISGLSEADNGKSYAFVLFDQDNLMYGVSDIEVLAGIKDAPPANATPIEFANGADEYGSFLSANTAAVAVPEPTSGLLLLLGMAGLALKRKRA